MKKLTLALLFVAAIGFTTTSCREEANEAEQEMNEAGEEMEDAGEEMEDEMEEEEGDIENALEEGGEEVQENTGLGGEDDM